ncbi:MAG: dihydropteroate synthase [Candidatus Omnitrophica bacterium]|nr:dihydropteroate synthase [Candidatus Omnitrophota bacterium]
MNLICGKFSLPLGERTLVMGILNVTPDSFSDGARFLDPRKAVAHALRMEKEGADLIDIGGESTRPGAPAVPVREELRRILPVIERLSTRLRVPISVDSSKASVVEAALRAGASLVNDVTALRDPRMASVVARAGVPVILMHMRGTPRTMRRLARYRSLVPEVLRELKLSIRKALSSDIRRDRILIDPGIGFAKSPQDSLTLLRELSRFKKLGFPVVVGPSRKSFIGRVLGHPAEDRLFGTAAAVAFSVAEGANIVRVHDVRAMSQVVRVADAIRRS